MTTFGMTELPMAKITSRGLIVCSEQQEAKDVTPVDVSEVLCLELTWRQSTDILEVGPARSGTRAEPVAIKFSKRILQHMGGISLNQMRLRKFSSEILSKRKESSFLTEARFSCTLMTKHSQGKLQKFGTVFGSIKTLSLSIPPTIDAANLLRIYLGVLDPISTITDFQINGRISPTLLLLGLRQRNHSLKHNGLRKLVLVDDASEICITDLIREVVKHDDLDTVQHFCRAWNDDKVEMARQLFRCGTGRSFDLHWNILQRKGLRLV